MVAMMLNVHCILRHVNINDDAKIFRGGFRGGAGGGQPPPGDSRGGRAPP